MRTPQYFFIVLFSSILEMKLTKKRKFITQNKYTKLFKQKHNWRCKHGNANMCMDMNVNKSQMSINQNGGPPFCVSIITLSVAIKHAQRGRERGWRAKCHNNWMSINLITYFFFSFYFHRFWRSVYHFVSFHAELSFCSPFG